MDYFLMLFSEKNIYYVATIIMIENVIVLFLSVEGSR